MAEKKLKINNEDVIGTTVSFQPKNPEQWVEYELGDGSTIRIKSMAKEIYRLHGKFDDDGNPAYWTELTAMSKTVEAAPHFMKKEGAK